MENTGLKRLICQRVRSSQFKTVTEVVEWMGAIQAQDLNSAKWAIGVRLLGSTEKTINDAIDKADIIRVHLLRPTWHFVSAQDYSVFLALTAPNINSALKYRRIQLNLDDSIFSKSNPALNEILHNGNHLTREELTAEMSTIIPDLDSSKMNHILMEAEMNGLICSGRIKNKMPTYALTKERIDDSGKLNGSFDKDKALRLLANKYFKSHGPATMSDFIWWSGLSAGDCRKALSFIKKDLTIAKVGTNEYYYDANEVESSMDTLPEIALLPAFDEFIIAYKDRSAVLNFENHELTVSANGVFRPVIVYDGQVIGLWNKSVKKGTLQISVKWFIKPGKSVLSKLNSYAGEYADFLDLEKVEVI